MPASTARRLIPLSALIALCLASGQAAAATYTWGGGSGSWRDANWSSAPFPDDDADVALIDGGKDGISSYVTIAPKNADNALGVGSLVIDAGDTAETVGSVFLNVWNDMAINGRYINNGGTTLRPSATVLSGTGTITNNTSSFRGYTILLDTGLTLENFDTTRFDNLDLRGTYRASGSAGSTLSVFGQLQQSGRLIVSSGSKLWLDVGSIANGANSIEVEDGGSLRLSSDNIIFGQRFVSSSGLATLKGGTLSEAILDGNWKVERLSVLTVRDRISVTDTLTLSEAELESLTALVLDGGGTYQPAGGVISAGSQKITLADATSVEGYGGIRAGSFVNQGRVIAGTGTEGLTINTGSVVNESTIEVRDSDSEWGLYVGSTTRGSFVQTAAGRLVFHFDDTVPSDQGIMRVYDATLDGTVELMFDAPPEIGVWYAGVWAVDTISGEFDRVIAPNGWSVETLYDDDAVRFRVTAMPEPDTLALFAAGLGLIGAAARRRKV